MMNHKGQGCKAGTAHQSPILPVNVVFEPEIRVTFSGSHLIGQTGSLLPLVEGC